MYAAPKHHNSKRVRSCDAMTTQFLRQHEDDSFAPISKVVEMLAQGTGGVLGDGGRKR